MLTRFTLIALFVLSFVSTSPVLAQDSLFNTERIGDWNRNNSSQWGNDVSSYWNVRTGNKSVEVITFVNKPTIIAIIEPCGRGRNVERIATGMIEVKPNPIGIARGCDGQTNEMSAGFVLNLLRDLQPFPPPVDIAWLQLSLFRGGR